MPSDNFHDSIWLIPEPITIQIKMKTSKLLREMLEKEGEGSIFMQNLSQQHETVWLSNRKSIQPYDIIFGRKPLSNKHIVFISAPGLGKTNQ